MSVIYTICQLGNTENETFASSENSFKKLEDAKKFCEKQFQPSDKIYYGTKKTYTDEYLNEFFGVTRNYFEESGLLYFIIKHTNSNLFGSWARESPSTTGKSKKKVRSGFLPNVAILLSCSIIGTSRPRANP